MCPPSSTSHTTWSPSAQIRTVPEPPPCNPSSGGAVSWPLLPSLLGSIGRWLPPGASVNAQHTAVYFGEHQHLFPFAVLALWAAVSCTVFWIWRHRHPGGRDTEAAAAASGAAPAG